MSRRMFRYVVPHDGQARTFSLTSNPRAVAATVAGDIEFWAEYDDDPGLRRAFRVFGTGLDLPDSAQWHGTCARDKAGEVWHLFEVPVP